MAQQQKSSSSSSSLSKVHIIDLSVGSSANPLNPLSLTLRRYIYKELQFALQSKDITSIIIIGNSKSNNNKPHHHFSAGADLTEFASFGLSTTTGSKEEELSLIDVVTAIEASTKPVVAAIDGTCMGGGLEVALACHYRVATPTANLGLPEVHVGVIPGAGGTQRLPRLMGLQNAIQFIITGRPVNGTKALSLKLIDAIVVDPKKQTLFDLAMKWAMWGEVIDPTLNSRRISLQPIQETPPVAHGMIHATNLAIPPANRGGEGMLAALEAIRAATLNSSNFTAGMDKELDLFLQTLVSEQGKARRHGFFATRSVQKLIQIKDDTTSQDYLQNHPLLQKNVASIQVGVIGAGTMGGGIALVLLQTGYTVWLVDVNPQALQKGVTMIQQTIESYVQRKRMTPAQGKQILEHQLKSTTKLQDLSSCQLIVEAVIERMSIKHNVFQTLQDITPIDCILLSNTSTLDIDVMSSVLRPERQQYFAGWHFFSPAHVMKLVEIVVGTQTSQRTVALLQLLTKKINKIGVVVGNCDGFCGNRMLKPYSAETALALVENQYGSTTIADVDAALNNYFGFALGPFQMGDLAGNDIGYNIRIARGWVRDKKNSQQIPTNRPDRYTELGDDMVSELGRLGQKVGKGWYDYDPTIGKGRKGIHSPEMEAFITKYQQLPSSPSNHVLTNDEIIERVLYPLVNEGFKILEENIVRTPADIDIVWLYGYGWPAWKGGPMYWADHIVGLAKLLQKLQYYHTLFPTTEHYVPSKLLIQCVQLNTTVEEYYRDGLQNKKPTSKL